MATKIKNLTIVNQQGVSSYTVGNIYNELILYGIKDQSDDLAIIYRGYTMCGETVFEAINAPIEVVYCPTD